VGVEVLEGNRGAVRQVHLGDTGPTGKPDPLQISIEVEHRPALYMRRGSHLYYEERVTHSMRGEVMDAWRETGARLSSVVLASRL
jgi:hypothetical protein